jgi:hypothetical protein
MIMNTVGRGKDMGNGKSSVVFRKYRLEVKMHKGCLNCLNGIELGNISKISFLRIFSFQWERMISGDPIVIPWNLYCWLSC